MGKGGMVRLVFFQTLLLTAAHAHCLRIALGAKFWFLSSLKISPPQVFGMVDERLGPLGFMGSLPVFLYLEDQMRDERPMRIFILETFAFRNLSSFPWGLREERGGSFTKLQP